MSGWIKICGTTDEQAVAAALAAGVDAIGFVFAPSVRQVTPARAAELARPARHRVDCIAVTRHPTQALIDEVLRDFAPDVLQTDVEDFDALRLPQTLARLPVLRSGAPHDFCCGLPARLLFEGPNSGTGTVSDWREAAERARDTRLILAGGLNAGNVADAIATVRPFGVDTSSGVEARPGVKSVEKIAQFAAAARAAFAGTDHT